MQNKEVWNEVYLQHGTNVPWAQEKELNQWHQKIISRVLSERPQARCMLDYGCGYGQIGDYFYQQGYQVELAELSDVITKQLAEKYGEKVPVYLVNTPNDIPNRQNTYDMILAIGVFHHLMPEDWDIFLKSFHQLLKTDGILFISGWDDDDAEISKRNESLFTHLPRSSINGLKQHIVSSDDYTILDDSAQTFYFESQNMNRKMHYFILNNKEKNK